LVVVVAWAPLVKPSAPDGREGFSKVSGKSR
jgi:hypothetical protein